MDPQRVRRAFARAMEEPSGERVCVAALLNHHGVDSDGIHVCGESMLDLYEALSDSVDSGTWRGWIDDGIPTSESAVREEVARYGADTAAFPDKRGGISAIGIPTRNRAGSVLAALRSYHTNASMHGRRVRFVVADSSSAPDRERLASALDVLRKDIDIEVEHLDEAWRANPIRTLADETDCSPDVLRFALYGCETCGTNYGANRNALLLATAGELSVHVDDDTTLPLFEAPDTLSGIAFSSQPAPNEYWFGACGWGPTAASFIEVHERLPGRPVARLPEESGRGFSTLRGPLLFQNSFNKVKAMKTLDAIRMAAISGGIGIPCDGKSPRYLLAWFICTSTGPFNPMGLAGNGLCYALCGS